MEQETRVNAKYNEKLPVVAVQLRCCMPASHATNARAAHAACIPELRGR